MKRLGFLGYGRFGHALADIFAERGYAVSAYDPTSDVPESRRNATLASLSERSDVIFVAVPVPSMPMVFRALRSVASPEQIVVDVGSVKLEPFRAMEEVFGSEIHWVASHPLFGPVSLARAETDLRTVICPNPHTQDAVDEVAQLYKSIGCQVLFLEPERHDRIMAQTHALAFFIAKGMLDVDVPTDSPAAPPSFQAMARTIESVRADAGHLITTLHRENPFAAEYRRRLLGVLTQLDRRLNEVHGEGAAKSEEQELSIRAPIHLPELSETRERIDEVDRDIFDLLLRRAELVRRAQHAKRAAGQGVVDPSREAEMLATRQTWAAESGLDTVGVRSVFEAVIELSCEIQMRET